MTTISILTEKSDQDEITDAYNHKGALCLTVREVKVSKLDKRKVCERARACIRHNNSVWQSNMRVFWKPLHYLYPDPLGLQPSLTSLCSVNIDVQLTTMRTS
jgi:hypothetical protein